jgi:hypothetical protein
MPLRAQREAGRIAIACIDPTNLEALSAVRGATGLVPDPYVATPSAIDRAIRRLYYGEAAPPPGVSNPLLNVTRTSPAAERPVPGEATVEARLASLEDKVDRLLDLVRALTPPGHRGS